MDPDFDPAPIVDELEPDDLLTLIYTSGTTGPPKGVQLTHRNLMALTGGVDEMIDLPERGAKVISWLPAAHIAERGAHYYLPVIRGVDGHDLPRPAQDRRVAGRGEADLVLRGAARLGEDEGRDRGAARRPARRAARAGPEGALDAAIKKVRLEQAGRGGPRGAGRRRGPGRRADVRAVPRGARPRRGRRRATSGAAPSPVEVLEFFHAIGIPVGELWGMSETCGVVTCNPPEQGQDRHASARPSRASRCKLAEDGEVLVKAPSVMPGYRNMPEKTAETFDEDGWLLTGDIGELDEDGYLKIVDRKKELIINAAGKNMSPANIESHLKTRQPADRAGRRDRRPAPLQRRADRARPRLRARLGEAERARGQVGRGAGRRGRRSSEAIQAAVDEANEKMARVEQIKKFTILPRPSGSPAATS